MVSSLSRLRPLATLLVAWLGLCPPIVQPRIDASHGATAPLPAAATPGDAASIVSTLGAGRRPEPLHRIAATVAEIRSVDLDADGRPDLVATGASGIRTWLNVGSGRFVEHAATRTILRRHSAPGFTAQQRSTHVDPAALIGDQRHALAPTLRVAERALVCTFTTDVQSAPLSDGEIVAGGSRAPPSSGQS
jgi:hypothetical protein